MIVDYSTFEEDESLWGEVTIIDCGKEQTISVELMPNEYIEVTDATKRSLDLQKFPIPNTKTLECQAPWLIYGSKSSDTV